MEEWPEAFSRVAAVGYSGQMHGLVLAGEDGRYLAAVKLYPGTGAGCWQMEALETRPGERRKGYGLELLRQTQGWL